MRDQRNGKRLGNRPLLGLMGLLVLSGCGPEKKVEGRMEYMTFAWECPGKSYDYHLEAREIRDQTIRTNTCSDLSGVLNHLSFSGWEYAGTAGPEMIMKRRSMAGSFEVVWVKTDRAKGEERAQFEELVRRGAELRRQADEEMRRK